MPRKNQIIAVVIMQYATGLYRTCVSLGRDNITYLGTHKDERSANEALNHFWRAWDEGQLKTPEDVAGFIQSAEIKPLQHLPTGNPYPASPMDPLSGPLSGMEQVFSPLAA